MKLQEFIEFNPDTRTYVGWFVEAHGYEPVTIQELAQFLGNEMHIGKIVNTARPVNPFIVIGMYGAADREVNGYLPSEEPPFRPAAWRNRRRTS